MELALLFSGVWISLLYYLIKYKRNHKLYIFIISIWVLSSLTSIVYGYALGLLDHLRIAPYTFLLCCLLISFYPFYRDDYSINGIKVRNWQSFNKAVFIIGIISILPFTENLVHVLTTFGNSNTDSLSELYTDKMSGNFDRSKYINWFSFLGRITNAINLKFQYCTLFLLFIYLCNPNRNKWTAILLTLGALNPVMYQLNLSGRSSLVFFFIRVLFLFFLFYNLLDSKVKAQIVKTGLIILVGCISLFTTLTLARYNASSGSMTLQTWVSLYIGESTINFNNNMWDISTLTQGDNCFSFFKNILGFDTFTDYLERRAYWGPKTGVDPVRFYTFIGDFFSDMHYFVLPFVSLISILLRRLIQRSKIQSILALYLYYTWGYICVTGITCYTLKTNQSMIDMTVSLIVIAVLSNQISQGRYNKFR